MNNSFCAAYGYGTAITQACLYQAMDQLGIAQYLTRVGLLLDGPAALDVAKHAWMEAPLWQEIRHVVEDMLVTQDWFELYVAQNLVMDGLLYPLIYNYFDSELAVKAGLTVSMLVRFQGEWFSEASKWIDATIKTAVAESAANKTLISSWTKAWLDRSIKAIAPIAQLALGPQADSALGEIVDQFNARAAKLGLAV
jgi:phenol hydroxylase P1 protein